ncbi:MAG: tetratricopeptide repeat protein [Alphaproteobacteria bacterium]
MAADDERRPLRVDVAVTRWPLATLETPVGPLRPIFLDAARAAAPGLVSCLMVTRGRRALAALAVAAYRRQTWRPRELVIVDDDPDDRLAGHVAGIGDPTIRHIRLPDDGRPLGELRNIAKAAAAGSHVCQWDDDDIYDPARIAVHMRVLAATGTRASFLQRWLQWSPADGRLSVSTRRVWEGSVVCEKAVLPDYPGLRRGEDTPAILAMLATVPIAHIDLPALYVYVGHAGNTHDDAHRAHLYAIATERFEGERRGAVLAELERRLPLADYRRVAPPPAAAPVSPSLEAMRRTALEATRARRWSAAADAWRAVVQAAPEDRGALLREAEALAALPRAEEARAAYARFIAAAPDDAAGPLGLARLERRAGDLAAALAWCEAALRAGPGLSAALQEKALVLLRLDRPDEAEAVLRLAEEADPGSETCAGLASIATYRGDWAEAERRWRAAWMGFRHPSALVEIATALVHQDHLDRAAGFLAALGRAPALGRGRLAAAARVARLTHDWAGLLRLLDGDPEGAAAEPSLAALHVAALDFAGRTADALRRLDECHVGRSPAEQAIAVGVLRRAGQDDRLHAYLLGIADGPALAGASVHILPDLLDALRTEGGGDAVRRALRRIERGRAIRTLKLAAIFERERQDVLDALPDPTRALPRPDRRRAGRVTAALDVPAGPTVRNNDRFVRRAITAVDAISARHQDAALDAMTSPAHAFAVAERIAAAIRAGRPLAAIRLGDGEGNFMPYADDLARHRPADRSSIQRIWWPRPLADAWDLAALEGDLAAAIGVADIVGVPDLYRLVRSFADGVAPNQTSRGTLAVVEHAARGSLLRAEALVTTCHFHNAFAYWRLWEPLLAVAGRCSLVSGRPELAAALSTRFGIAVDRVHRVPPERKYAPGLPDVSDHHFARRDEIRAGLGATRPGDVVLVAAGILGKIYCVDIRAAGGIAIDVGSLADYWCGVTTRTAHETAAFRAAPGVAQAWAGRPALDAIYPALSPSAFFAAHGASGVGG